MIGMDRATMRLLLGALAAVALSTPVWAASFYLVPDVPSDLGPAGTTFLPWEIVRRDAGGYGSLLLLPPGTAIDALHATDSGQALLSVEAPVLLGGLACQPEDVVRFDGAGATMVFDGSANGVPPGSNVDAVFLDGGDAGDLILSFDVPTTIGTATYDPADLVRYDGSSFTLFFDASAASPPIPPAVNLTGADRRGSLTIQTFDVPVMLAGQTFLPGQLVSWDGRSFASFHLDPFWPAGSHLAAVALLPSPGTVPLMDVGLSQARGRIRVSWEASCSAGAEDYAIYEGTIGSWYSHAALDCSDDGADRQEDIVPSAGDRYYLVVPLNANDEGSYGLTSDLKYRPAGTGACVASRLVASCP